MKRKLYYIVGLFIAFLVFGCESLEETYDEYLGDGMIRYVGKCSDLEIEPGWERLKVKWKGNLDANIDRVKITWQAETDNEPEVRFVEPKDIASDENLMDSIFIENLDDAIYTVTVSNLTADSMESIVETAYARPYTENHEDLRTFTRGVVNFYVLRSEDGDKAKDRLAVFLDEDNDNLKEMTLNFTTTDGQSREWDIKSHMNEMLGFLPVYRNYVFLLPEEEGVGVDFDEAIVVQRKGMLEGCFDTITFVPDTLYLDEQVWSAGFSQWLIKEFGPSYTEEDIKSLDVIELDYNMTTFQDLFYFPNLKKVILGKNRYMQTGYTDVNLSTTDAYKAMVTLQFLHDIRGVTVERYNEHYFSTYDYSEVVDTDDWLTDKGDAANLTLMPSIKPLDTEGWEITCSDTLYNGYKSNGAGYLLDGRVDTYFEPGLTGSATVIEVEFDMKEMRTLNGFKVVQPTTTLDPNDSGTLAEFEAFMSYLLQSVKVEVSSDGYTWEDATYETGSITIGDAPGETTFIELPEPKQVQYIRLTMASQMVSSTREGVALFSLRLADFIPY